MPMTQRCRDVLSWLIVCAVSVALLPINTVHFGPDSQLYMGVALDLMNGGPYQGLYFNNNLTRGPGFPLILTGSILVSGGDFGAAVWVPRLAFS